MIQIPTATSSRQAMSYRIIRTTNMQNLHRGKQSRHNELCLSKKSPPIVVPSSGLRISLHNGALHTLICCDLKCFDASMGLSTQGVTHHIKPASSCQNRNALMVPNHKTPRPFHLLCPKCCIHICLPYIRRQRCPSWSVCPRHLHTLSVGHISELAIMTRGARQSGASFFSLGNERTSADTFIAEGKLASLIRS
jgi:hypothetical protein